MEVMMNKEEKKRERELPSIPDYPDAPLPAWKHYGITNYADQRIQAEFDRLQYDGYMVGLEIAYTPDDEKRYAISFGKLEVPDDPPREKESKVDIPLPDEFLENLYQTVAELIPANCPNYSGEFNAQLTIVMTGSLKKVSYMCRIPEQCSRNHTDKRICRKENNGPWVCLEGQSCR